MSTEPVDTSPLPVRDDLKAALNRAWQQMAQTGAWLTGEQRLAIAKEARQAWNCRLCLRRKEALSPYAIDGEHDHLGILPETWVEAVHRIVTDSGRITGSWYRETINAGISEDEFMELLSVATMVTCMDTFIRGIGLEPIPLPTATEQGTPARRRPSGVKTGPGWAPTVAPEDVGPELKDFYKNGPQYIRRALTLVPEELDRFWDLMNPLYMANPAVEELQGIERAISRAQIEFIATRTSAYLDCFY